MQPERAEIVPEVCGQWKKGCSGKFQCAEDEEGAVLQFSVAYILSMQVCCMLEK